MPVIPATWEKEVGGSQPEGKKGEALSEKQTKAKRIQVIACFPRKHKSYHTHKSG
jgi:hypothetical protein